jgi:PAS domain S-box-containing protein
MNELTHEILTMIVENSSDSIVVTNCNGVIQYVNKSFTDITGYSYDEAVGQTPRILKSGFHEVSFYQELWKSILDGNKTRVLFNNKKKDGQNYYHEEIIAPVYERGNLIGFVSNGRDVTEILSQKDKLEEYCKFIDTVFETMSSQMSVFKIIKSSKYIIG